MINIRHKKLLTEEQGKAFNDMFDFDINENENIVVRCKNYDRTTIHKAHKPFLISAKIRKISFTEDGVNIFTELKKQGYGASLTDVQDAVNRLYFIGDEINTFNVKKIIEDDFK